MRRDARAATAGSTKGRGGSFGDFLRGAIASRASSLRVDGSGASAEGGGSRYLLAVLLGAAVVLAVLAALVPAADAATQRPFKETFGSAEQPTISFLVGQVAVDPNTGDVLVADSGDNTLHRFKSDGTPSPFSALGGNVIDGKEANGKPCVEEPASCDQTPQNGLRFSAVTPVGIAIDNSGGPTDGNIYITQSDPSLVDVFSSDGRYLGQITAAGVLNFKGVICGAAVDTSGALFVAMSGNPSELLKYAPSSNLPVNEDLVESFQPLPLGRNLCAIAVGTGPTAGFILGTGGSGNGSITSGYKIDQETGELVYEFAQGYGAASVAVDPVTGNVLLRKNESALEATEYGEFDVSGDAPVKVGRVLGGVRVQGEEHVLGEGFAISSSGEELYAGLFFSDSLAVFGVPGVVPTVTGDSASEITGSKALFTGSVDPEGLEVTDCYFEYGESSLKENTAPCEVAIPTDSEPHPVRARISGLLPNGHTYKYRLVAENVNGRGESPVQTLVTASTVATEAPDPIGTTTATLRGALRPEGSEYSACFFEYGLASRDSPEKSVPCFPGAAAIEPDFTAHKVSAEIGGLQPGESYRFRLVGTNSDGTLKSEELTFTTLGEPRVEEMRARDADQGSVTLEAKVNPSGFGTSYHFEWGKTNEYGNDIPADFEPFIGSGTEPVRVTANISGLSPGSTYHYRVVASNSIGTTQGPDQIFETLNYCGLPQQRCFELVSPRDAGPVALPGNAASGAEMHFQAAPTQGALAYVAEPAFPEATRGAEVLYRGIRGPARWGSTQISAPIIAAGETNSPNSDSSDVLALSPDLTCAVEVSNQPLTADASTRPVIEAGGSNLYRRNPDGSYTAITKLTPTNFEEVARLLIGEYFVEGISDNCGKVIFSTRHFYPGVPGAGELRLFEWDEGELRNVGWVPGPSGEVVVPAIAGAPQNNSNVLSEDGSRIFFSAQRQTSPNPGEIGQNGVFVRENGLTRDLSMSETSTPSTGAVFQYAAKDGTRVFFVADAGLTAETSVEGTDLYEYNLETEDLTDLSVEHDPGGAQVGGFIGASNDGSHVYFVAQGQLVPGKGKTLAQNQSANTYSIYGANEGQIEYAGTVTTNDITSNLGAVTVTRSVSKSSRVSADGKYLLFETSANVTGYESGGPKQIYLYNAHDEVTTCVSCRPDGQASLPGQLPLITPDETVTPLQPPRSLVVRNGEPSVYFTSRNRLANGAVEGLYNLYQWSHGQVFTIDTEEPGLQPIGDEGASLPAIRFAGANADGSDLYFRTTRPLTWEDGDERISVYDARIGGGFPEPPPPPAPCDPTREGSCQGSAAPPAVMPGAASATFRGPGNVKPKKHPKRQKKHGKKRKHQKKHSKDRKQANGHRRAGK